MPQNGPVLRPPSDSPQPRVFFFISSMEAGGAERTLLTYLACCRRFQPVLLLGHLGGQFLNEIPRHLPMLCLHDAPLLDSLIPKRRLWSAPLKWIIRCAVRMSPKPLQLVLVLMCHAQKLASLARQEQCTLVSSFLFEANIVALIAKRWFNPRLRVVLNAHDMASEFHRHERLKRLMIRRFYPWADSIVAVSHGVKRDLVDRFSIEASKIRVVHNPCDVELVRHHSSHTLDTALFNALPGPMVIAVGRLVRFKGYDLLIRALARLLRVQRASLVIIGDGEERSELERLIEKLGLQERVRLLGYQPNPWKYMKHADAFALPSRTEGFPLVIGEALALGLPVLAANCSPGVREYLQGNRYGLLIPPHDVEALTIGLERVLTDKVLRQRLIESAPERLRALSPATVVNLYEDALDSAG